MFLRHYNYTSIIYRVRNAKALPFDLPHLSRSYEPPCRWGMQSATKGDIPLNHEHEMFWYDRSIHVEY
jgi:hypothetical protein